MFEQLSFHQYFLHTFLRMSFLSHTFPQKRFSLFLYYSSTFLSMITTLKTHLQYIICTCENTCVNEKWQCGFNSRTQLKLFKHLWIIIFILLRERNLKKFFFTSRVQTCRTIEVISVETDTYIRVLCFETFWVYFHLLRCWSFC